MEDKSGACVGLERARPPQEAEALSDLKAALSTTWLDPWRACMCMGQCLCVCVCSWSRDLGCRGISELLLGQWITL